MLTSDGAGHTPELRHEDFRALRHIMQVASGIELPDEKRYLVIHRLGKRLREYQLDCFSDYLAIVRRDAAERQRLIDLLTTNETWFFREPRHFDWLTRFCKTHRGEVRVWSAASSTGEEAYSIAMTLAENCASQRWKVLGTDVSQRVIHKASSGLFPAKSIDTIPREFLKKYWLQGIGCHSGQIMAKPRLTDHIEFRVANLNEPLSSDIGYFHVAFLRNVLIYFNNDGKQRLVRNALDKLKPGGLLMVGHSESLFSLDLPLEQLAPSVYKKPL